MDQETVNKLPVKHCNRLKIGLDFHGVINKDPAYFKGFSQLAIKRGHEIHIVTGGPLVNVRRYLKRHGIVYTNIFAIMDYYKSIGEVEYFANGEVKVPDALWNNAKAMYCLTHNIDIHIDDTAVYGKEFMTPFCRYDEVLRKCFVDDGYIIDLSVDPNLAMEEIEKNF